MSRPVLVTGGQGFVGAHLLRLLDDAVAPEVDVTDQVALRAAVHELRPRAVVHLAALSQVSDSWRDPATVWQVNAVGTVNLLESVRGECDDARVLVVSTGEVYGRADVVPTPETAEPRPLSPYAASKAAAEVAACQAGRSGLDVVVARAFQHEGPGRDDRFAVGSWTLQLARARAGRRRCAARRRSRRRARPHRRARRLPRLPGAARPGRSRRCLQRRERRARSRCATWSTSLVALCRVPVTVEPDPERMRASDVPVVSRRPVEAACRDRLEAGDPARADAADTLDAARGLAGTGRMPA